MSERFTDRANMVMALAEQEARRFGHENVGTEHILLGLIAEGSGVGASALKNLGVTPERIRSKVAKSNKPQLKESCSTKRPLTPNAQKVIEWAATAASGLGHNYVGTEHLLLGLVDPSPANSTAATVLITDLGIKLEKVREEVLNLLGAAGSKELLESDDVVCKRRLPIVSATKHENLWLLWCRGDDGTPEATAVPIEMIGEEIPPNSSLEILESNIWTVPRIIPSPSNEPT